MSTDVYLKSKYGITAAEKVAIMAAQGNHCPGCGREFTSDVRTEVDHEHYTLTLYRSVQNGIKGWYGHATWKRDFFVGDSPWAKTKKEATKLAKKFYARLSVRGVLCGGRYAGCNRKIGRIDNIWWMENIIAYLRNPPAQKVLFEVKPLVMETQNESPASRIVSDYNFLLAVPYKLVCPTTDSTRVRENSVRS